MGRVLTLLCRKCGFQRNVQVGIGLMSRNPDIIASCLEKNEADKWKNLYDGHSIQNFSAQQDVFYCDVCRELKSAFHVEAWLKDGSRVLFGRKCRTCSGEMQIMDLQEEVICPVCEEAHLDKKVTGLWD